MEHILTCTGNLGADPERRTLNNGSTVVSGRLALATGRDKPTIWLDLTVWHDENPAAGKALADCRKGSRIDLVGRLGMRTWADKDGQQREVLVLTAYHVRAWPEKQDGPPPARRERTYSSDSGRQPQQTRGRQAPDYDDDISF